MSINFMHCYVFPTVSVCVGVSYTMWFDIRSKYTCLSFNVSISTCATLYMCVCAHLPEFLYCDINCECVLCTYNNLVIYLFIVVVPAGRELPSLFVSLFS